ncbi:hypothetical protein Bequi_05755 [Brachybacterium sp. JHP9]|uniref:Uncharacterized protein n=1 Tax=Brachybacterium equifaecis TaxID=2910770 RepID=A0ABT0QZ06_9MICO|nr:hypothetical protein [Brachybacterium equifaecis]
MALRSRSLGSRIKDQLVFSVVAVLALFLLLRLLGFRATMPGLLLSILITVALNVGLSYWSQSSARRARESDRPVRRPDGDIRWRDDRDR